MFLRYSGVQSFVRESNRLLRCAHIQRKCIANYDQNQYRFTSMQISSFSGHIRSTRPFTSTKQQQKSLSAQNLEKLQKTGTAFGQPTPFTHPHLLKPNELVAGVSLHEFKTRRQHLIELVRQDCRSAQRPQRNIVIVPASGKKYMTDKIPYVFRQNSDFFYLTGCLEPDSILVLITEDDATTFKSILFMRPKDPHDELWDGPRTGVEHSIDFFGVDDAHPVASFYKVIESLSRSGESSTFWYDQKAATRPELLSEIMRGLGPNSGQLESPTIFLHQLRLIKSAAEIELMRRTCEIASHAVNVTMKESNPGDSEHHIFARVDYHCRMRDASFLAYPPVVAAGNNAAIIHYINNTQLVKDGELVLMDAGKERLTITRRLKIFGLTSVSQPLLTLTKPHQKQYFFPIFRFIYAQVVSMADTVVTSHGRGQLTADLRLLRK